MLVGDFNVTLDPDESSNSSRFNMITSDMKDFIEARRTISVFDHAYSGPLFTWSNKQQESFLARKLDRALVNGGWIAKYTHSTVDIVAPEISDHCPVVIGFHKDVKDPPKPFKFFNFWTKHPRFMKIVQQSWRSSVIGNPMRKLHTKLKRLKADLKNFNLSHFGGITSKVVEKRRELEAVQVSLLNAPTPNLIELEKNISLKLNDLLFAEESFFKQKVHINWINEGDQNTKFFQKSVAAHQN